MGRVNIDDPVDVVLNIHPGRVLRGRVQRFGGAVSVGRTRPGELAAPPCTAGRVREPQRFPVRIILPEYRRGSAEDDIILQVNGQSDVIIYTGGNVVLNALGAAYIHAVAWLSYGC